MRYINIFPIRHFLYLTLSSLITAGASSPLAAQSLAQRLGYTDSTKLLILHADDLGVAHAENQASFEALFTGAVNSASIMAPCPWLAEVANFSRGMPKADLGLHLTLTSEWRYLKWGPVASRDSVSSLVDSLGHFYEDCGEMAAHAKPEEVERELRAQIEKALKMGINPTHFDSHMGCLHWTNLSFFEIYLKLGREYKVPVRLSRNLLSALPDSVQKAVQARDIVIDNTYTASPEDFKKGMSQFYEQVLRGLQPGVSELVIHLAYDNAEMRGVTVDHPDWGAAWRQADFNFFTSDACKTLLNEKGIQLVTWREIGRLLK